IGAREKRAAMDERRIAPVIHDARDAKRPVTKLDRMVRVPRDLSRLYRALPEETPRGEGEAVSEEQKPAHSRAGVLFNRVDDRDARRHGRFAAFYRDSVGFVPLH